MDPLVDVGKGTTDCQSRNIENRLKDDSDESDESL